MKVFTRNNNERNDGKCSITISRPLKKYKDICGGKNCVELPHL
jgi:hypothetical protein